MHVNRPTILVTIPTCYWYHLKLMVVILKMGQNSHQTAISFAPHRANVGPQSSSWNLEMLETWETIDCRYHHLMVHPLKAIAIGLRIAQ